MQRTRPGPTADHNDGDNCDWESKHGQDTDNGDWKDLSWDVVVPMMTMGIGFLAIVPIDGDRESLVFKFAIDPFLNLVRKLIGRGRCCRNRGRNGSRGRCRDRGRRRDWGRGSCARNGGGRGVRGRCRDGGRRRDWGRCRGRERRRRSRRFWRGARCLCVDGQDQAKSSGATKSICFHSFHLSMRCREKPVRIQQNDLVSSKFEGYAPSCLKIGAHLKRQRVTRLELATSSLARRCSTTELHPHFYL